MCSHAVAINDSAAFREVWAHTIFPSIQQRYDALRLLPSSRMMAKLTEGDKKEKKDTKEPTADADIIHHKMTQVLGEVRECGERRNAYMNITWTGPVDNTQLQTNIT